MDLRSLASRAAGVLSKNSPAILTGLGAAGFMATVVMVAKAAPAAKDVTDICKEKLKACEVLDDDHRREESKEICVKTAKQLAPLYGPPVITGILSVSCFICANKIHADRHAAVLAAYSLSEKTLAEYQSRVIEKLGEKAESDIFDEAVKEVARSEAPDGDEHVEPVVPAGMVRCFDTVTGRYFFSNREKIMEAESAINKELLSQGRVYLQDLYYELGLEERFALANAIGWDISYPTSPQMLDIHFTPMLDDEKNPVLAVNYRVAVFDRNA